MKSPLNSPLEIGIRVLIVLTKAYPASFDINMIVLLDHGLLHSADLGGPESLHPPLPIRAGELGVKRNSVELGLQVMLRAELVEMVALEAGIQYQASDTAYSFISILSSEYSNSLQDRASWAVNHFANLSEMALRNEMRSISDSWAEEFHANDLVADNGRHRS